MSLQHITLYCYRPDPDSWKIAIVLTELSIPFEITEVSDFSDLGHGPQAPITDVNPKGHAPAIKDPNTGLVLSESCAIVSYLITEYDKAHTLSYASAPEKHFQDQWLFFHASGEAFKRVKEGWYYDEAPPEKLPPDAWRYSDEIKRVVGVLDGALAKSKSGWLVGDKCTYVDLLFFLYNRGMWNILKKFDTEYERKTFPCWKRWNHLMGERAAVKKVVEQERRKPVTQH